MRENQSLSSSSQPTARIREEAERRFASQLARDCPPEERAVLAEWLNASPLHAQAYDAARRQWKELAALKQDTDAVAQWRRNAEAAFAPAAPSMQQEHRYPRFNRSRLWIGGAMAAGLAVVALLGTGVLDPRAGNGLVPNPFASAAHVSVATAELETAIGELRTEVLADGSAVTLNTGTAVEAQLTSGQRGITLKRGEALFEVQRDETRPFVVAVGQDTVTALGTRFQVRQENNEGESIVTLLEGSVRITRPTGSTRVLKPGERAKLDRLGGIIISRVDAEEAVSWSRGWLVFRNEPLSRVVAEVNRYADQPIRLAEPSLGSLRLSGNFRVGDSASMASAMAALLPLAVADAGDGLELRLAGSGG